MKYKITIIKKIEAANIDEADDIAYQMARKLGEWNTDFVEVKKIEEGWK